MKEIRTLSFAQVLEELKKENPFEGEDEIYIEREGYPIWVFNTINSDKLDLLKYSIYRNEIKIIVNDVKNNYVNCIFINQIEIEDKEINYEIEFSNCIFKENIKPRHQLYDDSTTFTNNIKIIYSYFMNNINFHYLIFKNAGFWGNIFQDVGYFSIEFENANFEYVKFKNVEFLPCNFKYASFHGSIFDNGTFNNSSFINADFSGIEIQKANFFSVKFEKVDFKFSLFNIADFTNSKLLISDFSNVNFHIVDFEYVVFHDTTFIKTEFSGNVNFQSSKFHKESYFTQITLHPDAVLDFTNATFYEKAELSFARDKETGRLLCDGKIYFNNTTFREEFIIPFDQIKELEFKPFIIEGNPTASKENFRFLEKAYKKSGDLDYELDMRYQYKKYENEEYAKKHGRDKHYWFNCLLDVTSKYFTDWKRALASMGWVYGGFATIYLTLNYIGNLFDISIIGKIKGVSLPLYSNSIVDTLHNHLSFILNHLYFSAIAFITGGFGDISPTGILKAVASLEGFCGIILTSMFMVTLAKRVLG